ncbi:hypothetical protein [Desulfobacca acetoxidans]
MAFRLFLQPDQLEELGIIRDLGVEKIQSIADAFNDLKPPAIRPSDLRRALGNIFPEDSRTADVVLKHIMSLYTLRRERDLSVADLFEGLKHGIEAGGWSQEQISQWLTLQPQLQALFGLPSVQAVVKVLDLSYDYENILQKIKILTDIRPIFDDEATVIEAAIVSYTMRLYFDSLDGSKSLSIALDEEDITKLIQTCQRALNKAKTSKEFMCKNGIERTLICGEEEQ